MVSRKWVSRGSWVAVLGILSISIGALSKPGGGLSQGSSDRSTSSGGRFIVAFDLSPEKGFSFTWPYESVRPAPYDSVLMVVETMPRVTDRDGRSKLLRASDSLRVNGRLLRPLPNSNPSDPRQRFEVKLSEGRLRLSLTVPRGFMVDRQYRVARIKLYQTGRI